MEQVKQAELQANENGRYAVSAARVSQLQQGVGMPWGEGLEEAVKGLGEGEEGRVVVIVSCCMLNAFFDVDGTHRLTEH